MKVLIIASSVAAIKCWANDSGNREPYQMAADIIREYCIHHFLNGKDYYQIMNQNQLDILLAQIKQNQSLSNWEEGVFFCKTEYCNSPNVKVDLESRLSTTKTTKTKNPTPTADNSNSSVIFGMSLAVLVSTSLFFLQ